ncbi:sigma-70 family RNA polymerase sigma factor [Chitinophaga sp. MM2321]|uniref:RNA polymerase sigma factor n=1 Tax=Chitinophaga sp. MM2321 TaxID=3137178 RepID=UPI0032D59863
MPIGEEHDDQPLLARLTAGSTAAFEEIYNEYYNGLLFFAQRFLPLHQAEDILADTFIKLWESSASFGSLPQLHRWLRVTVRNACLNVLIREKRSSEKKEWLLSQTEEVYEHQYFSDKLQAGLQAHILGEIERLPPRQQHIVRMFFLEEMDNTSIAAALQISVQAVKNQKVTALKILRSRFKGADLFPLTILLLLFTSRF